MRAPKTSILHVPGRNAFDFDPQISHGTVHYHIYHSEPIDRTRELQVYTPPGYESSKNKRYPLLVLQHGHSDSFATWVTYGKANLILDNLIAAGKAKPMIMVMLDGHPIPSSWGDGRSTNNTEELRLDLMKVVLPMLEKTTGSRSMRSSGRLPASQWAVCMHSRSASPIPTRSDPSVPSVPPFRKTMPRLNC